MLSFAQSTQSSASLTSQTASANQPQSTSKRVQPEQMAERRAEMYKKQYGLNDQQYRGVYSAELDYMKQIMDMSAKGVQPTTEQSQQMAQSRDARFQNVMTPDQYKQYSATQVRTQAVQQTAAPAGK